MRDKDRLYIAIGMTTAWLMGIGLGILCTKRAMDSHDKPPDSPPTAITAPEPVIMSIRELQTFLRDTGKKRYYIGPDGVDGKLGGPDSFTRKAWSNFICDRQAGKEFK